MKLSYILIPFIFLFTSCVDDVLMPEGENALIVYNNTNERIYFWHAGVYSEIYHYPDTILPTIKPEYISSISANNGIGASTGYVDWEAVYAELPAGKLSFYFFEINLQTQQQWDEIRQNPELIHRKDVTLDELKNNDYTVEYP